MQVKVAFPLRRCAVQQAKSYLRNLVESSDFLHNKGVRSKMAPETEVHELEILCTLWFREQNGPAEQS